MANKIKYKSPAGIAVYPHLTRPDNYKNKLKYKVLVKIDPKDVDRVTSELKALALAADPKNTEPKLPLRVDDEGNTLIRASSKYLPTIYDAKNRKVVDSFNPPSQAELNKLFIGGGSLIRIAAEPYPYEDGLSLQLKSVQVIKLVKWSGGSDFDEADGWDSGEGDEGFGGSEDDTDEGGEEDLDL